MLAGAIRIIYPGRQIAFHRAKKTVIEICRTDSFAGHTHQRVVAGTKRHGYRAQYAQTKASRVIGLFQCITILRGAHEDGGTVVGFSVAGADDMKSDLDVLIRVWLEALGAIDECRLCLVDDVA